MCQLHAFLRVILHVSFGVMLHVFSFLSICVEGRFGIGVHIEDSHINAWMLGARAAC